MNPPLTASIRILLADADAVLCVMARRALERFGFAVTIAFDGADLLARFTPEQYEVVIVGITLPRLNGVQVMREIKKRSPSTAIILLSDDKSVDAAKTGVNEGAYAYLQTPMEDFGPLGYTVARAIEMEQLHRQVDTLRNTQASPQPNSATTAMLNAPPTRLLRDLIESSRIKPLTETLQILVEASAQLMEATHASVLLAASNLPMQSASTFGTANAIPLAQDFIERAGDGFAYRIAHARKTLIDAINDPAVGAKPVQLIGTPLIAGNQVLGVLIVYPLPNRPINAARVTWLESLAAQGVLAIEMVHRQTSNEQITLEDSATGVLKHQVFLNMADREFRRSWRYNQSITAIVLEIDDWQTLTMRYGREFGVQALRQVANTCRSTVRSIDLIGQADGNALALLLLMTSREGAKIVAERLRVGINAIDLGDAEKPIHLTATLGICSYPRDGCASIFDLLATAHDTLRMAQHSGNNAIAYAG